MKKFSIFLSFVAIVAAIFVFVFVVNRNKAQKTESIPEVMQTLPIVSKEVIVSHPQNGQLVGQLTLPKLIEPPTPPPQVDVNAFTPPVHQQANPPINAGPPHLTQLNTPPQEIMYGPNSAYIFAVGDLLTIPREIQPYIRYISLYNIPKAKRKNYAAALSFVVNSLSTRRRMYIPEFVGASDETLIRLNISDYEWTPEAWEKLGSKGSGVHPQPEPYFHMFVDQPVIEKVKVKKEIERVKKVNTNQTDNRDFSKHNLL